MEGWKLKLSIFEKIGVKDHWVNNKLIKDGVILLKRIINGSKLDKQVESKQKSIKILKSNNKWMREFQGNLHLKWQSMITFKN